jgi:hypothetical protein
VARVRFFRAPLNGQGGVDPLLMRPMQLSEGTLKKTLSVSDICIWRAALALLKQHVTFNHLVNATGEAMQWNVVVVHGIKHEILFY